MASPRFPVARWLLAALFILGLGVIWAWLPVGTPSLPTGERASGLLSEQRAVGRASSPPPPLASQAQTSLKAPPAGQALIADSPVPPPGVEEIMRAAQARRESKSSPADRPARTSPGRVWPEPVSVEDDGQTQQFVLALDEVMVRGAEGKDRLAAVSAASLQDLQARIDAMSASTGETVAAVLYPVGAERNDYTRRLLSPMVTVKLSPGADAAAIVRKVGAVDYDLPDYAPGFAVVRTAGGLETFDVAEALRGTDGVEFAEVQLAALHQKRAMPNDPLIDEQWHLRFNNQQGAVSGTDINVETVWAYPTEGAGHRGRGVRIGIVDDGLQTAHPDLVGNVDTTNDKDWNGNDNDPNPEFFDDHGTACAGDAAARGNNNLGVSGSAPEATLVGMRLIAGGVTDSQEAEAMNYLPSLIQILSNSWGPFDDGITLEAPGALTRAALQNAATAGRGGLGTISMWAGGNGLPDDDSNADGYANSIYTIAVAAYDSQGRQAFYSEPGANIVITSPSNGSSPALGKTTVDRTGTDGYNTSASPTGDYTSDFGGTSSATPTAAGVVALMLEANPNLGWRDVQEILMRSARKVNPSDPDWKTPVAPDNINHSHKFGAGLIDAQAAVTLAQTWTNLGTQTSRTASTAGLPVNIPDNNTTGVSTSFTVSDDLRVEHVTVTVSATHPRRGDLVFVLTSPSGTRSTLIDRANDTGANYSNWTFASVRHWGESSMGTWTLTVSDTGAGDVGSLTAASVTVFGVSNEPGDEPAAPTILVSPDTLSGFAAEEGAFSAVETVTISGTNLHGPVTVTAPAGFEVSKFADGVFGASLELERTMAITVGDDAGPANYPGGAWTNGANGGSGFSGWILAGSSGAGGFNGHFIGSAATNGVALSNYAPLLTDGVAFSIYAGGTNAFQDAVRPLARPMQTGEVLSHSLGICFDNGNKGFTFMNGPAEVFFFNVNDTGYSWTGGGSSAVTPWDGVRENGVVIDFTFTRTETGFDYVISSAQDADLAQTGSVIAAGITELKYFISGAGGGDQGNLYFNDLRLASDGYVAETDVYVRLKADAPLGGVAGDLQASSPNASPRLVALSGTVNPRPPALSVDPAAVSALEAFVGTAGGEGSFSLTGADLVESVTVTAPENFEVSLSADSVFAASMTIDPVNGAVDSTVYVRVAAVAQAGPVSGTVSLSSTTASASVEVAGEVREVPPGPTIAFAPEIGVVGLRTTQGTPSEPLSVTVNGFSLLGNITAQAQAGLEVSLSGTAEDFGASVEIVPTEGRARDVPLYVRIAAGADPGSLNGSVTLSSDGASDESVPVIGEVLPQPAISVVPGSLEPFRTVSGFPSEGQTLTVSATDLRAAVRVVAPPGFEVAGLGGGYGADLEIPAGEGGVLAPTAVVLRAAGDSAPGSAAGAVAATSLDADRVDIAVSAIVLPVPAVSVGPDELAGFEARETFPSPAQSFTVTGSDLLQDLQLSAPEHFEISLDGENWADLLAIEPVYAEVAPPGAPPVLAGADSAADYGGNWPDASNQGIGFGPWTFGDNNDDGAGFSAGRFIGASVDGAGDIDTGGASFGVYANPTGAFSDADRNLSAPLRPGETLRVQLALNFDNGNKGFNLYAGGAGGAQIFNFNVGGGASVSAGPGLTLNAGPGQDYDYGGAAVLDVAVTSVSPTELSYSVSRSSPQGNQGVLFSGTIASSGQSLGDLRGLRFYNSGTDSGDAANNLYFNSLQLLAPAAGTGGTVSATAVYVRIKSDAPLGPVSGAVEVTSGAYAALQSVALTGNVVRPEILVDDSNLGPFLAAEGSPSDAQFIGVGGSDLVNPIVVTAPEHYEVSEASDSGYSQSVTLSPVGGMVGDSIVYVRIADSAPTGLLPPASLVISSAGSATSPEALTRTVPLAGSVEPWQEVYPFSLRITTPTNALSTVQGSLLYEGQAGIALTNPIHWSNSLTGQSGVFAAASNWSNSVLLGAGTNSVTFRTSYRVYETNNLVRVALDTPDRTAYDSGWTNGSSGGFGFAAWQLSATGGATNLLTASSPLTNSIRAFTLRGGSNGLAQAVRSFQTPLVAASSFEIELDANTLSPGGSLGLALSAGTNRVVAFSAVNASGQPDTFSLVDAGGSTLTNFPYPAAGFLWRFELLTATNYRVTVAAHGSLPVTNSFDGTLAAPAAIDRLVLSNRAGGTNSASNFYAGKMEIYSPSFTDIPVATNAPIVVNVAYPAWAEGYELNPATDGARWADPDSDGLDNFREFAFGTDPTRSNPALLESTVSAGSLTVRWLERSDSDYAVQSSTNLATTPFANDASVEVGDGPADPEPPAGYSRKQFTVEAVGDNFYRVEAVLP